MNRTLLLCLVAIAAPLALGGCKSNLFRVDYVQRAFGADADSGDRPFVGIVLRSGGKGRGPGVRVERVLRGSPADNAGIRAGDVLVRFGAQAVNSAADVEGILKSGIVGAPPLGLGALPAGLPAEAQKSLTDTIRKLSPTSHVELTVSREGEQFVIPVDLRSKGDYRSLIGERLEAHMKARTSELSIPFLFDYERIEIEPDMWLAYLGKRVRGPVIMYRDVDLIPLLGLFSLFRIERVPVLETTRVQVTTWPLRFTSLGNFDESIYEPGEDAYEAY